MEWSMALTMVGATRGDMLLLTINQLFRRNNIINIKVKELWQQFMTSI